MIRNPLRGRKGLVPQLVMIRQNHNSAVESITLAFASLAGVRLKTVGLGTRHGRGMSIHHGH